MYPCGDVSLERLALARARVPGSPRHAGWTALALLTVTAALGVLLAVLSRLAWPPVLVSIIGTLPALYLAGWQYPAWTALRKGRFMAARPGDGIQ